MDFSARALTLFTEGQEYQLPSRVVPRNGRY